MPRLDHTNNPHPDGLAVQIATLKALVGLHGREDRRILAVLVDQELGRAVDVEVKILIDPIRNYPVGKPHLFTLALIKPRAA